MKYLAHQAIGMVEMFSYMAPIKPLYFLDDHRSPMDFAGSAYFFNMEGHRLIGKEPQELLQLVGARFLTASAVILLEKD